MDDLQKRRHDREQRRKKQLEENLAQEIMLKDEMAIAKGKVSGLPVIERIRLIGHLEKGDSDH